LNILAKEYVQHLVPVSLKMGTVRPRRMPLQPRDCLGGAAKALAHPSFGQCPGKIPAGRSMQAGMGVYCSPAGRQTTDREALKSRIVLSVSHFQNIPERLIARARLNS
jgi:hypothetical protein